ncbi:MAG TPA: sugar ABC transporter permease [Candidatus Hydrogenedentes bacterium]|nr:sugar ABC transporter permease [Candidatus Hydrogenedentota bacterium]HPC15401.1 sugar ABC transporter permease [Candidatus Hydrogenedentota bacterium]HRT21160.1 sugar ABC transporter permease [Candidatus Hydrogenedentota bacterium]HRT64385.1 sugar ABC transporter permease [Candidatus Hydrogenedentota bacterium]
MTKTDKRNLRNGLLFAAPYIMGFLLFTLYPLAASLYYSLCQYNVIRDPVYIGLENYATLFTKDPLFWKSLYNTLYFTAFSVPLGLAFSIGLAMLLNQKVRAMSVYRTVFFLPTIVPIVASAVLWLWVLNPESGLINGMLRQFFGVDGPGWIADEQWSKPSLILMSLWGVGGAMVIFLAGLAEAPQSLYEVAEIDGAGRWAKFRNVTLPMLTPTILFNLVMGLIGAFQYFTQVYVMTGGKGGPMDSTMFYALYLYRNSFYYLRMGYASAMAWLLFVVILAATVVVLISSKRWVHYHGE